jgi:hypothetical protein
MALPARKSATATLEAAKVAQTEAEKRIGDLEARRRAALLANHLDEALKIADEVDKLRRLAGAHAEQVKLLAEEAAAEERARIAKAHAAHAARVGKELDKRVGAAKAFTDGIAMAVSAMHDLLKQSEAVFVAFPGGANAHVVGAAALGNRDLLQLLSHEMFRQGHSPAMTGIAAARWAPSLPAPQPPSLQFLEQPERIQPLVAALDAANSFAKAVMAGAVPRNPPASPVAAAPPQEQSTAPAAAPAPDAAALEAILRLPADARLGPLLALQNDLALLEQPTPAQDGLYARTCAAIAAADTTRTGATA